MNETMFNPSEYFTFQGEINSVTAKNYLEHVHERLSRDSEHPWAYKILTQFKNSLSTTVDFLTAEQLMTALIDLFTAGSIHTLNLFIKERNVEKWEVTKDGDWCVHLRVSKESEEKLIDLFRTSGIKIVCFPPNKTVRERAEMYRAELQALIDRAYGDNVILRIEQDVTIPLEMGGYKLKADAYPSLKSVRKGEV